MIYLIIHFCMQDLEELQVYILFLWGRLAGPNDSKVINWNVYPIIQVQVPYTDSKANTTILDHFNYSCYQIKTLLTQDHFEIQYSVHMTCLLYLYFSSLHYCLVYIFYFILQALQISCRLRPHKSSLITQFINF